eukprot:4313758-Prymnesium_polylepis.1
MNWLDRVDRGARRQPRDRIYKYRRDPLRLRSKSQTNPSKISSARVTKSNLILDHARFVPYMIRNTISIRGRSKDPRRPGSLLNPPCRILSLTSCHTPMYTTSDYPPFLPGGLRAFCEDDGGSRVA